MAGFLSCHFGYAQKTLRVSRVNKSVENTHVNSDGCSDNLKVTPVVATRTRIVTGPGDAMAATQVALWYLRIQQTLSPAMVLMMLLRSLLRALLVDSFPRVWP